MRHTQLGPALNSLSLTCQNLAGPSLLLWLDFPPAPRPQVFFSASRGLLVTPEFPFGGPAGCVGRVWGRTEGWIASAFSTLEMRSIRGAAKREVTGPHHGG